MSPARGFSAYKDVVSTFLETEPNLQATKSSWLANDMFVAAQSSAFTDKQGIKIEGSFFIGERMNPLFGIGHEGTIGGGTKGVNSIY